MSINPSIFKAYDIRGVYPSEINEENMPVIINSIWNFFCETIHKNTPISVVLGRDMRISSPSLFETAKKTLVDLGAEVIDVGLLSTPSFYYSVFHYGYDCGIQITASHNPKEYNGIKFLKNSPKGLIKIGRSTGMDKIKEMAINNKALLKQDVKGTVIQKTNILDDEIKSSLEVLDNPKIDYFTIAADPANAMGAQYIEALFKKIPANLIKINFNLDGNFPNHPPDPLDFNNLVDLQKKVIETKADFGLAPDGDGDRLFFIDEKGSVVPATLITALVAQELLKKHPGATILFDIRYILTPKKIVEENNGHYEITRVGHAFITEKMAQTGAIFAGESSAHYYYATNGNAESQLTTILSVLTVLTREKKPLSEILRTLKRSYESGEYNFTTQNTSKIMDIIQEKYKDGELDTIDGIAISYSNWRFSLRSSNTEPLLRLNVESYDKNIMEDKLKEITALVKENS